MKLITCHICKNEFMAKPREKTCSPSCKDRAHKDKRNESNRRKKNTYVSPPSTTSGIEIKLLMAAVNGTSYAEMQKAETIILCGRVIV